MPSSRFGHDTKVAHFIGAVKPWQLSFNRANGQLETGGNVMQNIEDLAYIWWRIFMEDVHHKLIDDLVKFDLNPSVLFSLSRQLFLLLLFYFFGCYFPCSSFFPFHSSLQDVTQIHFDTKFLINHFSY